MDPTQFLSRGRTQGAGGGGYLNDVLDRNHVLCLYVQAEGYQGCEFLSYGLMAHGRHILALGKQGYG